MSRIYPERLPENILHDPKRAAERAMYDALRQLPDPFTVFYSVAWLARRTDGDAQDGEADFVVAHPDLGVIILEVKGGTIQYGAVTGVWTSLSRAGETFTIKDPGAHQQAHPSAKAARFAAVVATLVDNRPRRGISRCV